MASTIKVNGASTRADRSAWPGPLPGRCGRLGCMFDRFMNTDIGRCSGLQPLRPALTRPRAERYRQPGSIWRSCNAATASQVRSCPQRRFWQAIRIRMTPTLTMRCPATSATAAPTMLPTGVTQERMASPLRWTVQAPHRAIPQPNFVPGDDHESPPAHGVSRRMFLAASVASGGGLMLGFGLPAFFGDATAVGSSSFAPNAFVRVGSDGAVTLIMPYLGIQATGNSNAIRAAWQPLRQAGATARVMLIAAAAKRWKVDPSSCQAERGEVVHTPSARRITYGALASDAAQLPVPEKVALKRPEEFKLIGMPAHPCDCSGARCSGERNPSRLPAVRKRRRKAPRHHQTSSLLL